MKKLILIIMIAISLLMPGCNKSNESDLEKLMKEKEYIIVDVRTKDEYDESHISGAINIPYDQMDENLTLDKEKNIFVYCKSGRRSQIAYETLKELGYTVYDLGAFSKLKLPKE